MPANYLIETTPHGRDLVVTGEWTAATERALRWKRVDGLVLNYARGFTEKNLEFLEGLRLRRLHILARTLDDLTPVHALSASLEELSVEVGSRATLDLEQLPMLRVLWTAWSHIAGRSGSAAGLTELGLLGFAAEDFRALSNLSGLTSLRLKGRPGLRSLDGLVAFPRLVELEVAGAGRLEDFSALRTQANPAALKRLSLEACTRLARLDDLAGLVELTYLNIGTCGQIESLRPLAQLAQLETLLMYESTDILDADLSPLVALPALRHVRLMSKRKYSPSAAHLGAALAAR